MTGEQYEGMMDLLKKILKQLKTIKTIKK